MIAPKVIKAGASGRLPRHAAAPLDTQHGRTIVHDARCFGHFTLQATHSSCYRILLIFDKSFLNTGNFTLLFSSSFHSGGYFRTTFLLPALTLLRLRYSAIGFLTSPKIIAY